MAVRNPQRLLEQALSLPNASPSDFAGDRRAPSDVLPEHLKVIKDTALRAKLIGARLAEGLQSPKGPQKIASIIRIYPGFNAPAPPVSSGSGAGRPRSAAIGIRGRKPRALPTLEEMEALITRVRAIEAHVAREVGLTIDQEIEQLQRRLADARQGQLDEAFHALGAAISKRNDSSAYVRQEALRRVAGDSEFPQRVFLRYLSMAA